MIRGARDEDASSLGSLFDDYRQFYGRPPDLEGACRYVRERLAEGDTRFLVSESDAAVTAFVHLLPSFDTLAMRPTWILEDLFVAPDSRCTGIGSALLIAAETLALQSGAARLTLSTAHTNFPAQRLYERHGWKLDKDFRHYHRTLIEREDHA